MEMSSAPTSRSMDPLETLGKELRKKHGISSATAMRIARELMERPKEEKSVVCFWEHGKIDWRKEIIVLYYPSGLRDAILNLSASFKDDVRATRDFMRHLRICAILALRCAGLHKDVAVYLVRHHTPFWDDMDPVEKIALRAKPDTRYYWRNTDNCVVYNK